MGIGLFGLGINLMRPSAAEGGQSVEWYQSVERALRMSRTVAVEMWGLDIESWSIRLQIPSYPGDL